MWVKLHYKMNNGKYRKSKRTITVKEAEKYYKENLKDRKDIIKVWLTHFGGWHTYLYKVLKDEEVK